MKILLTNDDGVNSKGINALYKILREEHDVYIIAPYEEKSGCSTAFTFKEKLKILQLSDNIFAVYGYTADCVNIGVRGCLIPQVDLIVSGINHGPNLGDDIYFSGTVGGARSAFIFGISGIAISINRHGDSEFFEDASRFLLNYISDPGLYNGSKRIFLNINYPDLPAHEIVGTKYASLGRRVYNDEYKIIQKTGNEIDLKFSPNAASNHSCNSDDSDIINIEKGYITITPLTLDCTDYYSLQALK